MKTIAIFLTLLMFTICEAQSNTSNLDTVYLKDKEAWDFYTSYKCIIIDNYWINRDFLIQNDPFYKNAIRTIKQVMENNTNSESIRKPLLSLGVKAEFIPGYKLIFNQIMSGGFLNYKDRTNYHKSIPDNIMYVIDRKTKLIKYIKCTDFILKFPGQPTEHAIDIQILEKDVLDIAKLSLHRFRSNGYKGR